MENYPSMSHSTPSNNIFFLSQNKTQVVTPHQNCLGETVLMKGHSICFDGEIWKIIP